MFKSALNIYIDKDSAVRYIYVSSRNQRQINFYEYWVHYSSTAILNLPLVYNIDTWSSLEEKYAFYLSTAKEKLTGNNHI